MILSITAVSEMFPLLFDPHGSQWDCVGSLFCPPKLNRPPPLLQPVILISIIFSTSYLGIKLTSILDSLQLGVQYPGRILPRYFLYGLEERVLRSRHPGTGRSTRRWDSSFQKHSPTSNGGLVRAPSLPASPTCINLVQTYIIFAVFNFVAFFHVYFLFPETAGKTLEETEAIFEDPNGIPYIGTPAWKTHVTTKQLSAAEQGDVEAVNAKLAAMHEHEEKVTPTTYPNNPENTTSPAPKGAAAV